MCIINCSLFGSSWNLKARQLCYIEQTGLRTFADLPFIEVDHNLLTALIERWIPETNSFHFMSDEATITLEDVACIYWLPIDGEPVCGLTQSSTINLAQVFDDLVDIVLDNKISYWVTVNFTQFRRHFGEGDPSKLHYERVAQAFIFCLISRMLFQNSSRSRGLGFIIKLFRKFEGLEWGPSCLTSLYWALSRCILLIDTSKVEKPTDTMTTFTGLAQLLHANDYSTYLFFGHKQTLHSIYIDKVIYLYASQVWAHSRMTISRPIKQDTSRDNDFEFPIMTLWSRRLAKHLPKRNIVKVCDDSTSCHRPR